MTFRSRITAGEEKEPLFIRARKEFSAASNRNQLTLSFGYTFGYVQKNKPD